MSTSHPGAANSLDQSPTDLAAVEAEILHRRAERLACRDAPNVPADELALLTFTVGSERYALPLSEVKGVAALRGYARVPGTPPALLGVVQLRGELSPLLDMNALLHLPASQCETSQVVLCGSAPAPALRVDRVEEVIRVSRRTLQSPEQAGSNSGLLEGVLPDRTALISVRALLDHSALGARPRR